MGRSRPVYGARSQAWAMNWARFILKGNEFATDYENIFIEYRYCPSWSVHLSDLFPMRCAGLVRALVGLWVVVSASGNFAGNLFQQDRISFQTYGLQDGLSQSTVQMIFQDSSGFMWFGTQNGLNRFDGYTFKSYSHEPFDRQSLPGNFVNGMFEQHDGTLWVQDGPSLQRIDRATESFVRYTEADDDGANVPLGVRHAIEDQRKRMWVAAGNGVFRYLPEADLFEKVNGPDGKPLSHGNIFALDPFGKLWLGSFNGLFCFDIASDQVRVYRHDPGNPKSLSSNVVMNSPSSSALNSIMIDSMGLVWVGTNEGVNRLDPTSEEVTRYTQVNAFSRGMRGKTVVHLHEDSLGFIWFVTREGWLNRLDRANDKIMAFGEGDDPNSGFRGRSITHLLEDRFGRIWVSTNGGGLNVLEPGRSMWQNYKKGRDAEGLPSNYLQTSFRDRSGNLWFGTFDQGVTKVSPERHKFRSYLTDPETLDLNSNVVWSINEDREGLLWVGTRSGIVVYDLYFDEVVKHYRYEPMADGLGTNEVRAIHFEGDFAYAACFNFNNQTQGTPGLSIINMTTDEVEVDGSVGSLATIHPFGDRLILGSFGNGMIIYSPQTGEWRNFLPEQGNPKSIGSPLVRAFADDPSGGLWVVSLGGLDFFDPESESFTRYRHDIDDPTSISSDNILSLHKDEQDRVWVGTAGAGLNLFDRKTSTFKHFTMRDGLPNNVVYEILSDDHGDLWLGTNHGLSRFSPETKEVRNFDMDDGLQSNEYNVGAGYKSQTGQLLLGGINGFDAFFTHELHQDPQPVPLVISAQKLSGEVLNSELQRPETIRLLPNERDVTMHFSALNFASATGTQYAYRLTGYDDVWRFTQNQRSVTYTNLPHGQYAFELRATNDDDVWNPQALRLPLDVLPRFYETGVFQLLFAIGLVMVMFSILGWQRGRILQRQQEALRELELARKSEELEYARDLQIGLLPKRGIEDDNVEVTGRMVTATEVGGDYYDFFEIDEHRLCVAFGDATGHGVAAGLVVGMVKMAATLWSLEPDKPIANMIEDINRGLQRSLPKRDMGMGFGLAMLDRRTGELELAVSGMPFPFIFRQASKTLEAIELKGLPLGFLRKVRVPSWKVQLQAGDTLILLSDGLGERFDERNKIWGDAALAKALERICKSTRDPDNIADRLLAACNQFAGERGNDDDMTIVVLHFKATLNPETSGEQRQELVQNVG